MRPDIMLTKLAAVMRCFAVPRLRWLVGLAVTLPAQGCIHDILNVTDPDIVTEETLRQYQPSPATNIARMFAFVAYVEVLAGEHYCNGVPLSSFAGSTITYGDPLSNDSLFALAAANADSAINNLGGADSARVRWLAQVVKGRALLDRGQFAAASTAVAGVPDTFHYDVTYSVVSGDNQVWALNSSARRYTVGNGDGGGLNFIGTRKDLRIRTKTGPDRIFDTAFNLQVTRQGTWDRTSPVRIATGVEARLIEAEAALPSDPTTWLVKLNDLRRNTLLYPPAPVDTLYKPGAGTVPADTTDSVVQTAREDLMFRERAFWMFGTGHRLGDTRRLVREYRRTEATVYPHGAWFKGGNFGDAIQMPIPFDEQNNPKFARCTDRLP